MFPTMRGLVLGIGSTVGAGGRERRPCSASAPPSPPGASGLAARPPVRPCQGWLALVLMLVFSIVHGGDHPALRRLQATMVPRATTPLGTRQAGIASTAGGGWRVGRRFATMAAASLHGQRRGRRRRGSCRPPLGGVCSRATAPCGGLRRPRRPAGDRVGRAGGVDPPSWTSGAGAGAALRLPARAAPAAPPRGSPALVPAHGDADGRALPGGRASLGPPGGASPPRRVPLRVVGGGGRGEVWPSRAVPPARLHRAGGTTAVESAVVGGDEVYVIYRAGRGAGQTVDAPA
ncbi:MAG: hypothetical protein WKF76_08290 [Nocardioidaceae bacterium]